MQFHPIRLPTSPGGAVSASSARPQPGGAAAFGLRAHLVALVLLALLPALGFGVAAAWVAQRSQQAEAAARLVATARALAAAIDGEIAGRLALLGLLEPALPPDGAAAGAAAPRPGGVRLVGPGQPADGPLAPALARAFSTGAPALTDALPDPAAGGLTAFLLAPLRQDGAIRAVALMPLPGARLAEILAGDGPTAITDGQGVLVAGSGAAAALVGRRLPAGGAAGPAGIGLLPWGPGLAEGAPIRTAWHPLALAPGWTVRAGDPGAASRGGAALALGLGGLLALGIGLAAVLALARRVLLPAEALANRAEALLRLDIPDGLPAAAAADPTPGARIAVTEFARLDGAAQRAAVALRESEAAFRAVFEQAAAPMAQAACATGALVRVNDAFCTLLGRPAAAMLGRPFADFVHEADRAADLEGVRRLCAGEAEVHVATKRYLRPDGTPRWVEVSASPMRDIAGQRLFTVEVATDVTERRAAEAALRDSETRLRRVQRIGRVGGFEIDLRTGVNTRTPEYMDLHGEPPAYTLEQHADWVRRLHPEDRERAEGHFLRAIAPEGRDTEYAQEYRIVRPSGEVRWIAARAEIERDAGGRPLRMLGAHVDVTELKAVEAALRDSEERLRLALEAAQLGAWEVDLRSGTARRSPRMLEIFGFGDEVQAGVYPAFRDRLHPDHREVLAAAVETVRHGPAERYRVEYRFLRTDGMWRWLESHGQVAARDPATGEAIRLIGTTQDVTERKEAEERQALLAREVDHRAKNALAVVQAALRLTPKQDAVAYARAVEGRVAALARAHTLLAEGSWRGAAVRSLAEGELGPFQPPALPAAPRRIRLQGPDLMLQPAAAQALSMTLHELATNATKYGALAGSEGHVQLCWRIDAAAGMLRLRWAERDGPPIAAVPTRRGFGSRVIEATVRDQLGGRLDRHWEAGGLVVEALIPLARALAGHAEGEAPRELAAPLPGI